MLFAMFAWLLTAVPVVPVHAIAPLTFTVSSTADDDGDCTATPTMCTLRQAINASNNNAPTIGTNTINFNIPGMGVQVISPATALPLIFSPTAINGYSQPGATANTNATGGTNAHLLIQLDGTGLSSGPDATGLAFDNGSSGSSVRGLVITNFAAAGVIIGASPFSEGGFTSNVTVAGNFLGTDPTGATAQADSVGVAVISAPGGSCCSSGFVTRNDMIGGINPADRNLISGAASSSGPGVFAEFSATGVLLAADNNTVVGNLIGADATGNTAVPNAVGVFVTDGGNNTIGGTTAAARNVISGNLEAEVLVLGIEFFGDGFVSHTMISGNYIGPNAAGIAALTSAPTTSLGVIIGEYIIPASNVVGGSTPGAGNLIVGHGNNPGVLLTAGLGCGCSPLIARVLPKGVKPQTRIVPKTLHPHDPSVADIVAGNTIGTTALPNLVGVGVSGAIQDIIVGGTDPASANTIVGNTQAGVSIVGDDGSTPPLYTDGIAVLGNHIFGNGTLGIDLNNDGPTANNVDNAASGPNGLQNYPTLVAATPTGNTEKVTATLNSHADTTYRIEFFANAAADVMGRGQGEIFLGATNLTLTASTTGSIDFTFPYDPTHRNITATATNSAVQETSEFSPSVHVAAPLTLDPIANPPLIARNAGMQTVNLTGISGDAPITFMVTSSNTTLIPTPTVAYTDPNPTGTLTFTPVMGQSGTSMITVTATSGGQTLMRTFLVSVNVPPTIAPIANPAPIPVNSGVQYVSLSGITSGGEPQTLMVSATSSNTALIPNPTVNYASPNSAGTLSYTSVAGQTGMSTITVTVSDGLNTTSTTFVVTVNAAMVTLTGLNVTAPTGMGSGNMGTMNMPIIPPGGMITLTITGTYSNGMMGAVPGVTCTSSDPTKVMVDPNTCKLTAISPTGPQGVTITATAPDGVTTTIIVVINNPGAGLMNPNVAPISHPSAPVIGGAPLPQPNVKPSSGSLQPQAVGTPVSSPAAQPVRH